MSDNICPEQELDLSTKIPTSFDSAELIENFKDKYSRLITRLDSQFSWELVGVDAEIFYNLSMSDTTEISDQMKDMYRDLSSFLRELNESTTKVSSRKYFNDGVKYVESKLRFADLYNQHPESNIQKFIRWRGLAPFRYYYSLFVIVGRFSLFQQVFSIRRPSTTN